MNVEAHNKQEKEMKEEKNDRMRKFIVCCFKKIDVGRSRSI